LHGRLGRHDPPVLADHPPPPPPADRQPHPRRPAGCWPPGGVPHHRARGLVPRDPRADHHPVLGLLVHPALSRDGATVHPHCTPLEGVSPCEAPPAARSCTPPACSPRPACPRPPEAPIPPTATTPTVPATSQAMA